MGGHDRDHWHVGTSPQEGPGGDGNGHGAGQHDQQQPTGIDDYPAVSTDLGVPAADADGQLDDLSAMQADDALLDALGGTDPDLSGQLADQELAALLLSWRQEADSEPMAKLVDTDMAMSVIAQARVRTGKRRHRFLVPVATAAAVLSIAFTGVGLAAKSAQPGDPLWGLTKVLYAEHATSVEAAGTVQADLEEARRALAAHDYQRAWELLQRAQQKLNSVQNEDGKNDLRNLHQNLKDEMAGKVPQAPGVPPSNSSPSSPSSPPQNSSSGTDSNVPPGSGADIVPGPGDSGTSDPEVPTAPDNPSDPPDDSTTPPDDTTTSDPSTPSTPTSGNGEEPSTNTPFEAVPPSDTGGGS